MKNFKQLHLDARILQSLSASGYQEPTPIQEQAIPLILKGLDIRGCAQTGTGKTAAFLLPILHRLVHLSKPCRHPRILILCPTRELATQIMNQAEKYSKYLPFLKTVGIGGGVPYAKQMRKLSRPYDILVATPGRLIDYLKRKKIDLSHIETLVLDEADRMLDMGFREPVETIVSAIPKERQTLLFSATLQGEILQLSNKLLKNPTEIMLKQEPTKQHHISQHLHYVDNLHHKNKVLDHLLTDHEIHHAIIFTATKRYADQLVFELQGKGHSTAALHGDMNQRQRTRTLMQLRKGQIRFLVATDVAARGIDVKSISHVFNFDLPRNVEDYVHRIGRTGRAGAKGKAYSFAEGRDAFLVKKIERFTGQPIDVVVIPGLEPKAKKKTSSFRKFPRKSFSYKKQKKRTPSKRQNNKFQFNSRVR